MKLLLVTSSGGHLTQLMSLRSWWSEHDRLWVTADLPDTRSLLANERVLWSNSPTTRHIPNMLRNLRLAHRILKAERPDVVVSTGAGIAPPFFLVARALGVHTVFLEVYDRLDSTTMAGRLCYPLSDRFLLQWDEQRKLYPRGIVVGRVL